MTEEQKAMVAMEEFATYARSRRIVFDSAIKPHRFPGRGLGIAATRKIQVCSGLSSFPPCLIVSSFASLACSCVISVVMDAVLTRVDLP
jgi:hypothetical protein